MRIVLSFVGLIVSAVILVSCQTLSKEECVAADWRVIGEQDGAAGHSPQQRFGDHVKACDKAGIVPDQTLWNQGYQVGLKRFCTPLSGLAHGQKGGAYANICPTETASAFLEGYNIGRKQHTKNSEITSIKNSIRRSESEISRNERLIAEGKIDQSEAESKIGFSRRQINDLNRELGRKEYELQDINREVEDFRLNQQFSAN